MSTWGIWGYWGIVAGLLALVAVFFVSLGILSPPGLPGKAVKPGTSSGNGQPASSDAKHAA